MSRRCASESVSDLRCSNYSIMSTRLADAARTELLIWGHLPRTTLPHSPSRRCLYVFRLSRRTVIPASEAAAALKNAFEHRNSVAYLHVYPLFFRYPQLQLLDIICRHNDSRLLMNILRMDPEKAVIPPSFSQNALKIASLHLDTHATSLLHAAAG